MADPEFFLENYEKNPFVLKHFLVFRDNSSLLKNGYIESLLLITVDGNILLFDQNKNKGKFEEKIADFAFKLHETKLVKGKEVFSIEISKKSAGSWLFNSKNKAIVKFSNVEKMNEFEQFFNKLVKL